MPVDVGRKLRKDRLISSRVDSTRLLAETLAKLPQPPELFLVASATGFYGARGTEELTEESSAGSGFLAEVAQAWEAAATPASEAGIRVVNARFWVLLSPQGGALAKMSTPFWLGAGGADREWKAVLELDEPR